MRPPQVSLPMLAPLLLGTGMMFRSIKANASIIFPRIGLMVVLLWVGTPPPSPPLTVRLSCSVLVKVHRRDALTRHATRLRRCCGSPTP